jgi:cytochrome P450
MMPASVQPDIEPMLRVPDHVPASLVRRFDFRHDPAMQIDPWAKFHTLNDAPDIFYAPDQGGYWAITRKSIVEEVLLQTNIFSSANNSIPAIEGDMRLIPPNIDPPEHAKYRSIINQRVFNTRSIETIEDHARGIMRRLIQAARHKGGGDLIADFARPFPVAVFVKFMRMPESRLPDFAVIDQFFRGEDVETVGAARQALFAFIQDWLNSDSGAEEAEILRELKAAEVDGQPLTSEKLTIMVLTLFFAGLDTVTSQLSFMAHFLATHPAHRDRLVSDPALIRAAIEEMMRRFGIANLCRLVVEDTELHGVTMKKGDLVMVSSALAGVDEQSYENAMTVDFERPNSRNHSGFGKGIHACAGQRLGRMELRIFLEEILSNLPNLRLEPGAEVRFLPGTIMAMHHLPVVWDVT